MDVSLVGKQIRADNCSSLWRKILEDINTQRHICEIPGGKRDPG